MQPLSIRLKGFKGIRAGLGLEELFIDLAGLPMGLIAIVGKTGRGKTTLLDNMHPYRVMPYKLRDSKEWSTGAFSYYDQCYGRDALKEYVFAYNGKQYRSLILIDAERRKQEAYLYVLADDGSWAPYSTAVKDGKTGPYDQAIEELSGSTSLFFSSPFRSQDARKISSYPRSEILGIVCELLNIDEIKEQAEKANKVITALTGMVEDLERQKEPVRQLLASRESLGQQCDQINATIARHESSLEDMKADLAKIEQQIRDLELSNAAQTLTRKRVEELKQRHAVLTGDIEQQQQAIASSTSEHEEESRRIDASIAEAIVYLQRETDALAVEEQQEKETATSDLDAIATKKQSVEALISRADEIRQAAVRASELEKEMTADRAQLETLRAAQSTLESTIATLTASAESIASGIEQDRTVFAQDSNALIAEEQKERGAAETDLTAIGSKREQLSAILSRAAEIRQSSDREKELAALLAADRPRLEDMRTRAADLRVRIAQLASSENELAAAHARLDDLRNLTAGLEGLDCHGDGKNTVNKSCKLFASAVATEQQIPAVEKEIKELTAKRIKADGLFTTLKELTADGTALAASVAAMDTELEEVRQTAQLVPELSNAEERLAELTSQESILHERLEQRLADIASKLQLITERSQARQAELSTQQAQVSEKLAAAQEQQAQNNSSIDFFVAQITESEAELAEARTVANLSLELDGATARLAELNEQEASVSARLNQKVADIAKKVAALSERSQERQDALAAQKQEAVKKWATTETNLQKKLASMVDEAAVVMEDARKLEATLNGDVDKEIAALNEAIVSRQNSITAEESILKKLHADLGNITGQLAEIQKKEDGLVLIDTEIAVINDEIVNWKVLAKACSNDGIIALELDDAGPSIAQDTNDLLHACYGPRFSVRLETQGTKVDGGLKEIFDITVFDAERDEEKSIRDMSGGEVTYIEDAITRAFCLYNLHRSDRIYDTMFTDEKDGALDAESKHEFLAIKRRALALGKHTREYFISHSPDLHEKADACIVLEYGKVSIQQAA